MRVNVTLVSENIFFSAGLNKDSNDVNEVKDLNSWKSLAEAEKRKGAFIHKVAKVKLIIECLKIGFIVF